MRAYRPPYVVVHCIYITMQPYILVRVAITFSRPGAGWFLSRFFGCFLAYLLLIFYFLSFFCFAFISISVSITPVLASHSSLHRHRKTMTEYSELSRDSFLKGGDCIICYSPFSAEGSCTPVIFSLCGHTICRACNARLEEPATRHSAGQIRGVLLYDPVGHAIIVRTSVCVSPDCNVFSL